MVNSSSSSAHPLARDRVYSEATLERLSYQHAPSIAERTSQARLAARRRMSERHGVAVVEMVEEQPPAPAEDAVEELDSEEATKLARRARRAARKAQKEAERAAEMARQLETTARRLFYGGFLALPLLWLVSLIYFHKEHKSPDANPNIKRCKIFFLRHRIIVLANVNQRPLTFVLAQGTN